MPVVNSTAKTLVLGPIKDSRWLTLEVCREFARNKCTRPDDDCRYAHPPINIEIQNGRVMCCFDSIKGRCQRYDPPCKYFHPPQHLKEQLLQNGRNNLIWRNIQVQGLPSAMPPFVPSMFPLMAQPSGYVIQPSNCLTNYYNSAVPSTTTVESQSPKNLNGLASTTTTTTTATTTVEIMTTKSSSIANAQDPTESESAPNGTHPLFVASNGIQNAYWMNSSSLMDSSLSSMAYYTPVFYQGLNTLPGVIPVVKSQLIPDMRNGGLPVYQCTAPTYPQVAMPPVPTSHQQTNCYPLAAPTINRY